MNWQTFISAALLLVAAYARCDAATPVTMRTLAAGFLRVGTYFVNPPLAPVALWLARRPPGLRVIGQAPDDPQPLGIGFQRGNPELTTAVDAVLTTMESDGTFGRLTRKCDLLDAR